MPPRSVLTSSPRTVLHWPPLKEVRSMRLAVVLLSLVLAISPAAHGQGGRSTVLGSVTDESGAAVPNVSVTVVNTGTQLKRTATSDANGNYEARALDVGTYDVTVEASGFRRMVVRAV